MLNVRAHGRDSLEATVEKAGESRSVYEARTNESCLPKLDSLLSPHRSIKVYRLKYIIDRLKYINSRYVYSDRNVFLSLQLDQPVDYKITRMTRRLRTNREK